VGGWVLGCDVTGAVRWELRGSQLTAPEEGKWRFTGVGGAWGPQRTCSFPLQHRNNPIYAPPSPGTRLCAHRLSSGQGGPGSQTPAPLLGVWEADAAWYPHHPGPSSRGISGGLQPPTDVRPQPWAALPSSAPVWMGYPARGDASATGRRPHGVLLQPITLLPAEGQNPTGFASSGNQQTA